MNINLYYHFSCYFYLNLKESVIILDESWFLTLKNNVVTKILTAKSLEIFLIPYLNLSIYFTTFHLIIEVPVYYDLKY